MWRMKFMHVAPDKAERYWRRFRRVMLRTLGLDSHHGEGWLCRRICIRDKSCRYYRCSQLHSAYARRRR